MMTPYYQPTETSLRLLLVDDITDVADSLAVLLELEGYEVRTAYTGRSALEVAHVFQPEVVLLDLGLPEMDGFEVARRLRASRMPSIRLLIALTAYGSAEDRARTHAAGFDHHLVKPVEPEVLLNLLRSCASATAVGPPCPLKPARRYLPQAKAER